MIQNNAKGPTVGVLKSAQTVLTVLQAFAHLPYESSLAEVARVTGLPKMKAHRALHTLTSAGFLFQNPKSRKFRLHHSVLTLAKKFQDGHNVRSVSHDILQDLALEIGEDITLAVMDENQKGVIFVDRLYGGSRINFFCDVGKRLPLHVGAAAKAILAYLPKKQFEKYLKTFAPVQISPYTIVSVEKVRMERRKTLEKGYSFSSQEVDEGVSAVGACLLNANGYPAASVAIAILEVKMTAHRIKELGKRLRETASEISSHLGHGVETNAAFKNR